MGTMRRFHKTNAVEHQEKETSEAFHQQGGGEVRRER
jgi:hypothetical protein